MLDVTYCERLYDWSETGFFCEHGKRTSGLWRLMCPIDIGRRHGDLSTGEASPLRRALEQRPLGHQKFCVFLLGLCQIEEELPDRSLE